MAEDSGFDALKSKFSRHMTARLARIIQNIAKLQEKERTRQQDNLKTFLTTLDSEIETKLKEQARKRKSSRSGSSRSGSSRKGSIEGRSSKRIRSLQTGGGTGGETGGGGLSTGVGVNPFQKKRTLPGTRVRKEKDYAWVIPTGQPQRRSSEPPQNQLPQIPGASRRSSSTQLSSSTLHSLSRLSMACELRL